MTYRIALLAAAASLTLVALACAPEEDAPPGRVADPNPFAYDDPREAFDYFEERVLNVDSFYVGAIIDADSLFAVELVAELWAAPENRAKIVADGNMADFSAPATLRFVSDGRRMAGGRSREVGFDTTAAPALREAIAIGLTRMGLLHNLSRLYTGNPPDRADGGVAEWVEVHSFEWLEPEVVARRLTRPMRFTVRVDGQDAATATLYLRRETGLPMKRKQQIVVGTDTLTVEERYTGWAEGAAAETGFAVDSLSFR